MRIAPTAPASDATTQATPAGAPGPSKTRQRLIVIAWMVVVLIGFATVINYDWPGLIAVGLATGLVFGKDRSLKGALLVTRDWIGLFAFLTAYGVSRAVADTLGMPIQEQSVIAIDEFLGFGETWVHRTQRWIDWDAPPVWWEVTFPLTYATHFMASIGALIVLYVTNRPRWKRFMTRWVALSAVGLTGYIMLPTVPPWLASENGTTELVREGNPRGWSYLEGEAVANLFEFGRDTINPIAAMPSLHAAYPMLLLIFFGPAKGFIGRVLLAGYCFHMGFAIVISGQHWVIDVIAGWACAIAVHLFFNWRERPQEQEVRARSRRRRARGLPDWPADAVPA